MSRLRDVQRRIAKRFYFALTGTRVISNRAMARHGRAGELLVLSLHQVNPRPNRFWPGIRPDDFAELVSWLVSVARVVRFADLATVDGGDDKPLAIISFDDGYRDFVDYAMPIMAQHGVGANLNVIGESLETGQPPRELRICELLEAAPREALAALNLPGVSAKLTSSDPLAADRFGAQVTNAIKQRPPAELDAAVQALHETLGVEPESTPMMSVDDVRTAAAAGHEIGAHAYTHRSMEFASDDEFIADLERCRSALARAGSNPTVYAFPNGSFRASQIGLLQSAGVDHVLLVGDRPSRPGGSVHPRLTIRGHSASELKARATGLAPGP